MCLIQILTWFSLKDGMVVLGLATSHHDLKIAGTFAQQLGWVFVGSCHPSAHGPPAEIRKLKEVLLLFRSSTHTQLCPFRLSGSCVSQKVAGKACSPWNADSGGLNFKSKTRGIWETTSNYHESKWTRRIDFLASLGVLFIGLRRKCPLWGQSSNEDTHPPPRGHLEKDSEGWFVQGRKSERNVKDIWWKIGKGWFLWLLCNILMTYGKLWICILLLQIVINYVNSNCLLETHLFLHTATDSDLVHWECISIYSIICVLCLHSYVSCMFIKSTYTNIDFCIITIRNIE